MKGRFQKVVTFYVEAVVEAVEAVVDSVEAVVDSVVAKIRKENYLSFLNQCLLIINTCGRFS